VDATPVEADMSQRQVTEPDREEWLEWRRGGIGSSDISALMGISPYGSPLTVWMEKVQGWERPRSEAMQWGNILERTIAEQACAVLELEPKMFQMRVISEGNPLWRATVDCWTLDGAVVETKVSSEWPWKQLPEHYRLQILWQMMVTGATRGWVAALFRGVELVPFEVLRDPSTEDEMLATATEFWANHVATGEPPPIDPSEATAAALGTRWKAVRREMVLPDGLIERLVDVVLKSRAAERARNLVEAEVKAILEDADTGVDSNGRPVVYWSESTRKSLDQKALSKDHPELVELYKRDTPYRRFTLAKRDEEP
jgi:putative phage-type endonuclease